MRSWKSEFRQNLSQYLYTFNDDSLAVLFQEQFSSLYPVSTTLLVVIDLFARGSSSDETGQTWARQATAPMNADISVTTSTTTTKAKWRDCCCNSNYTTVNNLSFVDWILFSPHQFSRKLVMILIASICLGHLWSSIGHEWSKDLLL